MQQALATVTSPVDYINAHGTSTPAGDIQELKAVRAAYQDRDHIPVVGSTKSLSGHSLGAAGVQEAIYSLLMQQQGLSRPLPTSRPWTPRPRACPLPLARRQMSTCSG